MRKFAITCLVIILFVIINLTNWMWRYTNLSDNHSPINNKIDFIASLFLTLISLLICFSCIYHIVKWGKDYFKD